MRAPNPPTPTQKRAERTGDEEGNDEEGEGEEGDEEKGDGPPPPPPPGRLGEREILN